MLCVAGGQNTSNPVVRAGGPSQEMHIQMTQTATKPPEPQRLRALERANEVRLARAELKRQIAEGEVTAADVILRCPREASRWTVAELLV